MSDQKKEVTLHRFKNYSKNYSLQKLLIHIIYILFTFVVLFCSHSAYAQSGASAVVYIDDFSAGYGADNKAVDLGLNVYWAKYNVGASGPSDYGNYFTWNEASTWNSSNNYQGWVGYWRTPTNQEFKDLTNNTNGSVKNFKCTFINKNDNSKSIILTAAGSNTISGSKGVKGYYWASDQTKKGLLWYGYRFNFDCCNWDLDYWNKSYEFPIRPVIDKVTIIVTTSGGNTIQRSYPKGTKIKIGAYWDDCHRVESWTKSLNGASQTITPNNTSGDNGDIEITITEDVTYTANFSTKTTNLKAMTEDYQKGSVGLNVGN